MTERCSLEQVPGVQVCIFQVLLYICSKRLVEDLEFSIQSHLQGNQKDLSRYRIGGKGIIRLTVNGNS